MLKLVGGCPSRFFASGTVSCPTCARALAIQHLGELDGDTFRLQCDGCGEVATHATRAIHVEVRPERRWSHRPF